MKELFRRAAKWIASADAILIGAGAGMGVDSGLPDFRGNEGFWNAYPPFRKLNLSFVDLANPEWFESNPARAWGFYGHRLNLYRETSPHPGFEILRNWIAGKDDNGFIFTSNVDGQFQKAGFDDERVYECHGSIHFLQCASGCHSGIWQNELQVEIDLETMLAEEPLPACPECGGIARPCILMFNDWGWNGRRSESQANRYREWLQANQHSHLAILEFGAGTHVPTVRYECERRRPTLIRINPREPSVPSDQDVGIACGGLEAIRGIAEFL